MIAASDRQITLACISCGWEAPYERPLPTCPRCGESILEARYDLESLRASNWLESIQTRPPGLWRYFELLPVRDPEHIISLGEGGTPLIKAVQLGAMLGLKNLYIKDERQGPTGSFKDRQASVALSVMNELGVGEVVVASTGNVAIAYSAYAARAGIKLWAFLPSLAPGEKMREVAIFGSEVIKVTGTYDQTKVIANQFAQRKDLFFDRGIKSVASVESMKTIAFEITEQLGGRAPDWFIQAVSGGTGPLGVMKGFSELQALGAVDKLPSLGIIQSAGCAPMVDAFKRHSRVAVPVENPTTLIATLSTGDPGRAYQLLFDLMEAHGGAMESVTDEEAFQATKLVARVEGLSVEPATAVAFGGLAKLVRSGAIKSDEIVVLNCSGHTFPVETHILGDKYARQVDVSGESSAPSLPEEGLLSALEQVESTVRKIVVIEDNPDAARLISRILQTRGNYTIELAFNGIQGLAMVQRMKPDLVITDLMMPEMDGFQVIDRMKNDENLRDIPVIVLTAKELSNQERTRLSGQIDGLLQKGSFLNEDLLQNIMKTLT